MSMFEFLIGVFQSIVWLFIWSPCLHPLPISTCSMLFSCMYNYYGEFFQHYFLSMLLDLGGI